MLTRAHARMHTHMKWIHTSFVLEVFCVFPHERDAEIWKHRGERGERGDRGDRGERGERREKGKWVKLIKRVEPFESQRQL